MELNVERLADAEMRTVGKMDFEDMAAMKVCLLSAGALVGLGVKNRFLRRLTGLTCTVLAAGLAVPLCARYINELREGDAPSPVRDPEGTFSSSDPAPFEEA